MNSPLQKLQAVPSTVTEEVLQSNTYTGIQQQILDLEACQGSMPEKVYISALSALNKEANSLLGTDLQIGTINLSCNPVKANKDKHGNLIRKDKGRGDNVIKGGGNAIAGGLITVSGTGFNGEKVNNVYPNVEVIKAIAENSIAVLEFLSRPNMKFRYCQQQTVEEGHMSPEELFA